MIKDTDDLPHEEIYQVRYGNVPNSGASVPVELWYITLLVHGYIHQPGTSLNPMLLGFYGGCLT